MYRESHELSLDGCAFAEMKSDFDSVLTNTVKNMENKKAEEATINLKLKITLERGFFGGRIVTIPSFVHDVTSVMTVKMKEHGTMPGQYEMYYDKEKDKWAVRLFGDGQESLFSPVAEDTPDPTEVQEAQPDPDPFSGYNYEEAE